MISDEQERQDKDDIGEVSPKFTIKEVTDIEHPQQGNNWKAYCWALRQFMPTVVGKKKWKSKYLRLPIQDFVSITGKYCGGLC